MPLGQFRHFYLFHFELGVRELLQKFLVIKKHQIKAFVELMAYGQK